MKHLALCLILLASTLAFSQTSPLDSKTVAFLNVNVIPMDRERVLSDQTVVVRNGLIAEVGDARRVRVPKDAQRIDGKGKFLIPGLVDMHVHLLSDEEFPDSLAEDELKVMVAQGLTTVRLMIGTPEQLILRARAAKGEILAPTLYLASPQLTGRKASNAWVVTNETEARDAVRRAKRDGYDFIKLTTFLEPTVYEAIIDEAARQKIRVVGHADSRYIGLARALKSGQQIEHLDSYLEALLPESSPVKGSVSDIYLYQPKNWESLDYIDGNRIPEIARATVQANPFSTPTLNFFKVTFGTGKSEEAIKAEPDYRFWPQKMRDRWFAARRRIWANPPSEKRRQRYVELRNKIVRAIHDAGGKIMAGSDTPDFFFLYGFTIYRELKALREAGLSNYAVLASATRNPSEFFGTISTVGTIERGKRADLLLLDANPLEDIANAERRAGVMLRGRWMPQSALNKELDEIAPRFQRALDTTN
jgi:cytosine/adenosine deaminase-related metal-dependent hydrolase